MPRPGEPQALRRGREFHRAMQASWAHRHGGVEPHIEQALFRSGGIRGRADVRVIIDRDDSHPFQTVVELKDRNFDRLSPRSVRQLIARDRRQLLRYVDALIDLSSAAAVAEGESIVMGAICYSRGPQDEVARAAIEAFFGERLLAVMWEDETAE